MTFTNPEIIQIRDGLRLLEKKESDAAQVISEAKRQVAIGWWNTVKPNIPQTRNQALTAYHTIQDMIKTETDADRLSLLRQKLFDANEKFKERKKNG